jgi:transposase
MTPWEHEPVLEAKRIRRRTVEHVVGRIEDWMGRSHSERRRLPNIGTEMHSDVPAYNGKRIIAAMSG